MEFLDLAEAKLFTDNTFLLEITELQRMFTQLVFPMIAGKNMAPKKGRGIVSRGPGVARVYLLENFSSFPTSADEVMNGHILHIYMSTGEFSLAKAENQLKQVLRDQLHVSTERCYRADFKRVVYAIKKYRSLNNPDTFRNFRLVCEQHFDLKLTGAPVSVHRTVQDVGTTSLQVSEVVPRPSVSVDSSASPIQDAPASTGAVPACSITPTCSTRSATEEITPRKIKLKKRLEFAASSSSKQREQIKELRKKLKTPKRVTNQAVQRKNAIIAKKNRKILDLKEQLCGNVQAIENARMKKEIVNLKKAHRRLITWYSNKAKKQSATVSIAQHNLVKEKLQQRDAAVAELEYENIILKEQVEKLQSRLQDIESHDETKLLRMKSNEKTYSCMTRMMVFDHIVHNVPTANIPALILSSQSRSGVKAEDIPQKTTVELMARELGALSELQAATTILRSDNVTVGFDATTQEGAHVNTVHFTTTTQCCVAALDQLPGGTAADYAEHVVDTVDRLSLAYCYFMEKDFMETKQNIISKIKNSMTDRCAANHAALRIISCAWRKSLNELNCHLHPLDTFASACRSALKKLQPHWGKVYGNECIAANVILQVSKLRYKDGKGDPRGFITFLDNNNLPRGLLPRYRGNRLHVMYEISAVLVEHYELFVDFFNSGTSCGSPSRMTS